MAIFCGLMLPLSASAQKAVVKGSVKDSNGELLMGAGVVVKGTSLGTITDLDGNFVLEGVDYPVTLVASFIGMEDHEFGDVSSVNTDIIKPGQCFSVEPGIYLMDEGIGVRIEDIVLITEDGCEVLNNFTKDLIVVPMED